MTRGQSAAAIKKDEDYRRAREMETRAGEIFGYCRENRDSLDSERHSKHVNELLMQAMGYLQEELERKRTNYKDLHSLYVSERNKCVEYRTLISDIRGELTGKQRVKFLTRILNKFDRRNKPNSKVDNNLKKKQAPSRKSPVPVEVVYPEIKLSAATTYAEVNIGSAPEDADSDS